jgi:hypothetical protein
MKQHGKSRGHEKPRKQSLRLRAAIKKAKAPRRTSRAWLEF